MVVLVCHRCGYEWVPRVPQPKKCPRCGCWVARAPPPKLENLLREVEGCVQEARREVESRGASWRPEYEALALIWYCSHRVVRNHPGLPKELVGKFVEVLDRRVMELLRVAGGTP